MQIEVIQHDLLSDLEVTKVADCTLFNEDLLAYCLDDTNVKVSFNDDEILLVNRTPQTITTIHCKDNHGECKVISSKGELNFEVVVEEYEVKPSNMVLKYRLLTNGDLVSYFRYEWKGIKK